MERRSHLPGGHTVLTIGPIRRPERRRTKRIGDNRQLSEFALVCGILAVVAAVMMSL
jgi:hypothetical protein